MVHISYKILKTKRVDKKKNVRDTHLMMLNDKIRFYLSCYHRLVCAYGFVNNFSLISSSMVMKYSSRNIPSHSVLLAAMKSVLCIQTGGGEHYSRVQSVTISA